MRLESILLEKPAALDVWIGMISTTTALYMATNKSRYLQVAGGRYILTGLKYRDHTGPYAFEVRHGRSPGFFLQVSGSKPICLSYCPVLHKYVYYLNAEKKVLAELFRLEKEAILPNSHSETYGYLQHRGCGRGAFHSPSYHDHLISWSCDQKDAVSFVY